MNSEALFDALTDVREEFINEAKEHKFKKSRKALIQRSAIAASFALILGIGSLVLFNNDSLPAPGGHTGGGGGRPEGATTFMSYAGPIFPLSLMGDADGVTAGREIIFDFSEFGETRLLGTDVYLSHNDIMITDNYVLSNDTATDKTIQILYPFAGRFSDLYKLRPSVDANGIMLETNLTAGSYSGGFTGIEGKQGDRVNLREVDTWEGYLEVLADGEYIRQAFGSFTTPDQTVTIYEFSNVKGDHNKSVAPTLAASFNLDYDNTVVLTYNFNGGEFNHDMGFMRRSFFTPREGLSGHDNNYYMLVIGDDITNLDIRGFENGACNPREEVDHVTADVRRYEANLNDMLALMFADYMDWHLPYEIANGILDLYFRAAVELLFEHGLLAADPASRYHTGEILEVFVETFHMERVFYLTAEVEIPAGEGVKLSIAQVKQGSFDFFGGSGSNVGVSGYDMLTTFSSNLSFTGMAAGLKGSERINIVRQNFGFDLANGILSVTLDLQIPHYYLEVVASVSDD